MANAWMPEARRIRGAARSGILLAGGAPRAVWQTTENDPRAVSAHSAAQSLAERGGAAHLVWHPLSGDIVQLLPATAAARSLSPGAPDERGSEGRVCVVVAAVGFALEPFTERPIVGLAPIIDWLDSWGVARRWPAGPPSPAPYAYSDRGSVRLWARGGHFGHSQVPGSHTGGPGSIAPESITGRARLPRQFGPPVKTPQEEDATAHNGHRSPSALAATAPLAPAS